MELVYIKIIRHYLLENQEFNFSNKYRVRYDEGKQSYDVKKVKYIDGFYGDNITNVTAIVGDNGCGKSTLLRILFNILPYGNVKDTDDEILFAMLENDELHYYSSTNKLKEVVISEGNITTIKSVICVYDSTGNFTESSFKKSKVIYSNNFFDYSDYFFKKHGAIEDLSFGGLMANDYRKSSEMHYIPTYQNEEYETIIEGRNMKANVSSKLDRGHMVGNYYNCEILRQLTLKFANDTEGSINNLPFEIPTFINMHLNIFYLSKSENYSTIKSGLVDLNANDRDGSRLLGDIDRLIVGLECVDTINNQSDFVARIAKSVLLNAIKEVCLPSARYRNNVYYYDIMQSLCTSVLPHNIDQVLQCLIRWSTELEKKGFPERLNLVTYIDFVSWLNENGGKLIIENIYGFDARIMLNTIALQQVFADFIQLYSATNLTYRYIDFYWPLSSGEFNLFSLYARFFSVLQKEKHTQQYFICNNFPTEKIPVTTLTILIDEADITFHPKWQQRYIKSLLDFISPIYKPCSVQIIFTTHSPILLSDIEHSSVIRMTKKIIENATAVLEIESSEKKTFAQNIHTLFADSFVLDVKNLGETLGDFAYAKINDCLELLTKALALKSIILEKDLRLIEYVIERVGEPVVSEMLNRKLLDYKKSIKASSISKKIDSALDAYESLSNNEKKEFIKSIIKEMEDA